MIIGNPPYVEYSGIRDSYTIRNEQFITTPAGNLYAYVWERALRLSAEKGRVGFIVPISSVSTPRMEEFVTTTRCLTGKVWISNYAVRPSKLFVGVDMNLTILISQVADHDNNRLEWTTTYQRWNPIYREFLFTNILYTQVSNIPLLFSFAVPKLRDEIERELLTKISKHDNIYKLLSPFKNPTKQQLSYRTAGGRYYKIFLDKPLDSESKSNKTTSFKEDIDVRVVLATLSSNLWWWYYTLHFDMYNCKDYMIFGFLFSYPINSKLLERMASLGKELVSDLFVNADYKTQEYATTGAREQIIFISSKSKPIINEIDRVLAEHYGFTDEELDFIINYDIKYRMGRDSEENDD